MQSEILGTHSLYPRALTLPNGILSLKIKLQNLTQKYLGVFTHCIQKKMLSYFESPIVAPSPLLLRIFFGCAKRGFVLSKPCFEISGCLAVVCHCFGIIIGFLSDHIRPVYQARCATLAFFHNKGSYILVGW